MLLYNAYYKKHLLKIFNVSFNELFKVYYLMILPMKIL